MFESLLNAFRAPDIRRRILYVLGLLIVFRLLAAVPVPGIDAAQLKKLVEGNPIIGLLDLFSGGGLASFSVVALGLNPYINASIIMQLMQGVVPSLQALSREGEFGRNKLNQYTRYLSVPMSLLQAYGFLALLNSQGALTGTFDLASFETLTQLATLTAGSIALMWIGELITERGIGNGISFIIFAGIVSRAPGALQSFVVNPNISAAVAFGIVAIAAVGVIIYIQEGQRRIPIQYASRVRGRRMYQGGQTFLPLRVNQAGVIPIIFAVSILLFPQQLASYFTTSGDHDRQGHRDRDRDLLQPELAALHHHVLPADHGLHVLLHGVHVQTGRDRRTAPQERRLHPGHPPGPPDTGLPCPGREPHHVRGRPLPGHRGRLAIDRGPRPSRTSAALGLGGTSLLIVVSVVVETMKQIEAQLMMRNYEGFIR